MQAVKHEQSLERPVMTAATPPPPPLMAYGAGALAHPGGWTAPSNPPASGPEPRTAVEVLDMLIHTTPSTRGAVLASVDGFPLAKNSTMTAEPSHAAMLAAAMGIARQLVAMGQGSTLRQLVVDHDSGLLLVWPIGAHRVLAVLAGAGVDQRSLRSFVQTHVRILADRSAQATS